MPEPHRQVAGYTRERLTGWAAGVGPATAELIEEVIIRRGHPQQGCRSALGILRLSSTYGRERLEAAARRALVIGAFSLRSIESILRCGLDQHPLPESSPAPDVPITHANIRGAHYYTMLSPNQTTRYEC